jgi:hypothetical protein
VLLNVVSRKNVKYLSSIQVVSYENGVSSELVQKYNKLIMQKAIKTRTERRSLLFCLVRTAIAMVKVARLL